jgi:hypothetical protein
MLPGFDLITGLICTTSARNRELLTAKLVGKPNGRSQLPQPNPTCHGSVQAQAHPGPRPPHHPPSPLRPVAPTPPEPALPRPAPAGRSPPATPLARGAAAAPPPRTAEPRRPAPGLRGCRARAGGRRRRRGGRVEGRLLLREPGVGGVPQRGKRESRGRRTPRRGQRLTQTRQAYLWDLVEWKL